MTTINPRSFLAGALLALALVTAACGASTPTVSPDPGGGGVAPGNPGGGAVPVDPGPGGADPGNPEPTIVVPVPGVTGIHDATVARLDAAVNGRSVAVRVSWWSGVEPCYALAGVDVVSDGRTITLSVREGSAAGPDTMCIEIAVYKATIVDLGELEPGTWTIRAAGDAAPVEVTIAG